MTSYDPDQRINVQVAMNNVLVISEVLQSSQIDGPWKPLLLFVPVRLGINDINPTYFSSLKVNPATWNEIQQKALSMYLLLNVTIWEGFYRS